MSQKTLTELALQLGKLESKVGQIEQRIDNLHWELDRKKPSLNKPENKSKVLDRQP